MFEIEKGMIVRSRAGHDNEKYYVVVDRDEKFVYLSDGRLKTVRNLKRKKRKHIQPVHYIDETVKRETVLTDGLIRTALEQYADR